MFTIRWTPESRATYERLRTKAQARRGNRKAKGKRKSTKDEGLFKQVTKTIWLLGQNPKHPGLHTHEFTSMVSPFDPKAKVFEAYVQNHTPEAYRVFWCYGPQKAEITIITITAHP